MQQGFTILLQSKQHLFPQLVDSQEFWEWDRINLQKKDDHPDWIESLREGPVVLEDLRGQVDRWLTWLDRRFDRQIVNDRLREFTG
ncbi:hypothetical protein K2O51_33645 (plasmid) [Cupriavidus pinatubonensis]|uniref:hypothetical protein n=1 Tax=Cupriavidus pinatubonensis TaxID=248026 RepID=UPI001C73AF99|nr:hypothetical protein [Cupriavidus pinatubonensis]QYY34307.1 hypothetical protein K2O51_33645 [Cupriavidus pinatubonensis]